MNTCFRVAGNCDAAEDGTMNSCDDRVRKLCEKPLEHLGKYYKVILPDGEARCQTVKISRLAEAKDLYGSFATYTMIVRQKGPATDSSTRPNTRLNYTSHYTNRRS